MSINMQLDSAGLSETQREVIKGGYGLNKEGTKRTAIQIAVGLHISTELVRDSEAKALSKLKETKEFTSWLESRLETDTATSGEVGLLQALDLVDAENPKPYLLGEETNDRNNSSKSTSNDSEAGGGNDTSKDATVESTDKTTSDSVGTSSASGNDGSGKDGTGEQDGSVDSGTAGSNANTESEYDPNRIGAPRAKVVCGYKFDGFETLLQEAVAEDKAVAVLTDCAYNTSTYRQLMIGIVLFNVDYSYKRGTRKVHTTLTSAGRLGDLELWINNIIRTVKPKSINMSVSSHFNTVISAHEFLVTLSHT